MANFGLEYLKETLNKTLDKLSASTNVFKMSSKHKSFIEVWYSSFINAIVILISNDSLSILILTLAKAAPLNLFT